MKRKTNRGFVVAKLSFLIAATMLLTNSQTNAQCPISNVTSGLQLPLGIVQSNKDNLLISESGPRNTENTGRISIVSLDGTRRTLLAGLPSGPNDIGDPSGPVGLFMSGRTLYVLIGMGDVVVGVINPATGLPIPGVGVPNPDGPSSPIFSSVLAIHFSANAEMTTQGITLSLADHLALASGEKLTLEDSDNNRVTIELVADFPNYIPNPIPNVPNNVRHSNPFGIVGVGDQLYVTDGSRNLVWEVDIPTGDVSTLAEFPTIPNPTPVGAPNIEAVPTGIDYHDGQLLVTLFRGFPFPPGTSVVEQIDPATGQHAPLISGLRTAIGVLGQNASGTTEYLVLQHNSGPILLPPWSGPGKLIRIDETGAVLAVIADGPGCLTRPTAMTLDKKTNTLYVIEYSGRVLAMPAS